MVAGAINIGLIATGGGAAKALIKNGVKGALSYSGGAAIISLGSTATLEVSAAGSLLKAGYGGSSMLNSIKNMGNDLIKLSEYISQNAQGSVRMTSKEATKAANKLGYNKIKELSHGQPVFENAKGKSPKFITPDVDGHNGGVWKGADSVKNLRSKSTRSGTYDGNLNRIGD